MGKVHVFTTQNSQKVNTVRLSDTRRALTDCGKLEKVFLLDLASKLCRYSMCLLSVKEKKCATFKQPSTSALKTGDESEILQK